MFISILFINRPPRYLTWLREIWIIFTMFSIFFSVKKINISTIESKLIKPITYLLLFSCTIGLFCMYFHLNFSFETPAKFLLPHSLVKTDFGNRLVTKTLFSQTWFAGMSIFRLKSIFTYATSCAIALALYLIYFTTISNIVFRRPLFLRFLIVTIICSALLFTLTRTPLIAMSISLFFYFVFSSRKILTKLLVIVLVAISILILFKLNILNSIINLREGSYITRSLIYRETIDAFLKNPLGYGSYLDIDDLPLPLGSHSTWLGIAFKYGIFGITGFTLMLLCLILRVKNLKFYLPKISLPIIICIFIISITEEIYLDALTGLISMVFLGAALAAEGHFSILNYCILVRKKMSY